MSRRTMTNWLVLLMMMSLSGCVKIGGEVDLHEDGTSQGEITFEMAKQTAALGGITSGQALAAKLESSGVKADGASWSGSETDQFYIAKWQGTFPATGMPWTTTRQGSTQTIEIVNKSGSAGQLDITLHLDGYVDPQVGAHTTRLDDNTVRVAADLSSAWSDTVVVDLSRKPTLAPTVLLVLLLAAGGVGAGVVLLRRIALRQASSGTLAPQAPVEGSRAEQGVRPPDSPT